METQNWEWLGVDHITYAVWDIAKWRAVYMDCFGFREMHYTSDACPNGTSSMRLCGLESGDSRIALVSPINRASISHVALFLDKHGDHSVQHIAYRIKNLEAFVQEMTDKQFKFVGGIKIRTDLFGPIKQIFAKRFDSSLSPATGSFYEFVERPEKTDGDLSDFFSGAVAGELYDDVEKEILADDGEPFIDLAIIAVWYDVTQQGE